MDRTVSFDDFHRCQIQLWIFSKIIVNMCVRIICIIAKNAYFAFNVFFNWKLHQENMNEGNIFFPSFVLMSNNRKIYWWRLVPTGYFWLVFLSCTLHVSIRSVTRKKTGWTSTWHLWTLVSACLYWQIFRDSNRKMKVILEFSYSPITSVWTGRNDWCLQFQGYLHENEPNSIGFNK